MVLSKLNSSISYPELKKTNPEDSNMETDLYEISVKNVDVVIAVGNPRHDFQKKNVVYDRDVVKWWHQALQNVDILSGNWDKACYLDDAFYFFDPPYRDSFADYGNAFSDDELLKLIKFSDNQKQVFLANRDEGDGWFERNKLSLDITTFSITYTAGRRKKVTKKNMFGEEEEGFEAKPATEVLLYRSKK